MPNQIGDTVEMDVLLENTQVTHAVYVLTKVMDPNDDEIFPEEEIIFAIQTWKKTRNQLANAKTGRSFS